ncbi:MAG: hypothetical protein JSV17_16985 [Candidatus Aminicenantes bacterium]|nr:MAG: hypothetical protein JSV17_16985 [Candidatus Aminicenantes bacterium]
MKKFIQLIVIFSVMLPFILDSASHPYFQEIISNHKTPQPENGIPIRIVFEEELSIGAEYGDEEHMFGNRVYFNVDGDGNFYVNDWDKR